MEKLKRPLVFGATNMELKIKKLRENAVIPTKATVGSAGFDLYAAIDNNIEIPAKGSAVIPTGIAIALPSDGYVALIFPRSGLSVKYGISMLNCVGVIDSDYRGELSIGLINHFETPYTIKPGERIAQLLLMPIATATMLIVDELDDTVRGEKGFGSTGR